MSDDQDDETPDQNDAEQAVETAGKAAGAASKAVQMGSEIAQGDAAGAVGAGLGAAGGALDAAGGASAEQTGEAREAINAAGAIANTAAGLVGAGRSLVGGDVGKAAGAAGSATDAARYLVPDHEVRGVLEGVGSAARGIGQAASALQGGGAGEHEGAAGHGGGDDRDPVRFHLEVQGASEAWGVTKLTLHEHLNEVPTAFVEARYHGHVTARELLHSEAVLFIERQEHRREFRGIVWHARVDEHAHAEEVAIQLEVTPRAALLGTRRDRKLFQEKTIVEVIKEVYANLLGSFEQAVNTDGLQRSYETREYVVQYDETDLAFISRLCEEEGIFWFFEHEAEQPVLHLADTVTGLAAVHGEDGVVEFLGDHGHTPDFNSVWDVHHVEEVGSTDVLLRGYDWTNPTLDVEGDATGRSDIDPAREVYDPRTQALLYHRFNGSQYGGNTATIQAGLRAERLDLDRQQWSMTTSVVGARVGTTIELSGAPDPALDQRYLIVGVHADGHATEGVHGSWENTLEIVPASMPYRPQRKTPRPRTGGPTTAIVVGPSGEEIHTDEHGRVKVRFHWDRDHARGDEHSSCWMRVAHNWAGPGFGTFFLPRIGMEVVVSFLEGDPDRPLVTSCVYHGQNRVGVQVPDDKTQSLIRTKSSPQSDGFNEMRFEDKAGSEFIYVHAQKDYNEEVEHCHSTHVKVDQSNTVDHDQTETVGNNQTLEVKGERMKTVHKPETTYVFDTRTETVHGVETLDLRQTRQTTIGEDEDLTILRDRKKLVKGTEKQRVEGERTVVVTADDSLSVRNGGNRTTHIEGEYRIKSDGKYLLVQGDTEKIILDSDQVYIESSKHVHVVTRNTHFQLKSDGKASINAPQQILLESGGTKIEISPSGVAIEGPDIQAKAGESALKLESSGATLKGSNVDILADMFATVKAILARIN